MASQFTCTKNHEFNQKFDWNGSEEYLDAMKGYYADSNGKRNELNFEELVKSRKSIEQINQECPLTSNPSYWKNSCIDSLEGVFEIIPKKVYQVRGKSIDMANFTVIRGQTGWIVIDCMSSIPSCKRAFGLIKTTVEDIPVSSIIITHSHFDHFGGYAAVGNEETPLYLPSNFMDAFIDENVLAAPIMGRRADYMWGLGYRKALMMEKLKMEGKLPQQTNSTIPQQPTTSFPKSKNTCVIKEDCTLAVDGIVMDFILTPNTEAPSNMMIYIPQYHILEAADNMMHAQHNLGTLRGAKVRSGKTWSECIDNVIIKYGKDVQYHLGGHGWHMEGNEKINHFWKLKRDVYKFIHDQTLRYANLGYTPNEIAELIQLPKSLANEQCCRDLYGALSHNIKSQYQLYIGWYDGNPAHLNELPPKEQAVKYIKAFGGEENTLKIGKEAFDNGEYRWAATVLNHLVFANPSNEEGRELLAKTYDQLSYTQECLAWKYIYATGAFELRRKQNKQPSPSVIPPATLPLTAISDLFCVSVNPQLIEGVDSSIQLRAVDTNECVTLIISNGVLHTRTLPSDFTASVIGPKALILASFAKAMPLDTLISSGKLKVENIEVVEKVIGAIDLSKKYYTLIEPNN
ncbi:alkyl sulfatase, putative [Entamoeba histolytica HM-1:IMSS-B]|uniref:Alkyl sulfatase, putative n=6 Tax=Entamoeba histolytica TaxID=5759 RepID=C4M8Z0_ENTH1|nr:alkyl sulfatase, putative [Entamoeba histolytica HM-1:IMSS]EMD49525.1 alkyl/arylsulfatase BDS1, putative [Entamoeba histolytica KU27]EMH77918.1 alkyl sulfatase, putative [Entamoeba histolytica HM-1:IMSS-B]EMS14713.1 alkyl/aryl-sulfatase BDS1, putative [Entamoeba histolytica HM-3:IMSS]ENY63755.1 alkyl/aryl-sulfatase BDS1, putative [Entamoeba histolytica HM-1:IMSS-A]GAT98094.1 alkyl sulfatase putative [Entamoeba histolytica]|eukprot:XP_651155.1 alkyl sulfatase, putative [Entamoeba histolytica HM-1:IMSS]